MMKKILSLILICSAYYSFGQQIPQYSQYLRNQYMVNPAAAGVYDFTDITLSGRLQWVGFGDEPMTAYVSGSKVLGKNTRVRYNPAFRTSSGIVKNPEIKTGKLKHAVGGQIVADQYGAFSRLNLSGTYALHIPVSKNYNLSFGTKLGISNNVFDKDKAKTLNIIDPLNYSYTDGTYDQFAGSRANKYIMDIGAGLYFYSNKMFIGVAADNLSKDFVEFGSGTVNFNTQIHYNVTAGIKLPISEDFSLMPAILVKNMQPAPFSVEGTLLAEYKEWMWFGASYRNKDAVVAMFGLNLSQRWKFGYSYDFSVSRMNKVSSGGHELVLGIMIR